MQVVDLLTWEHSRAFRRVNSMLDYAGWNGTRRLTAISQVTVAANALLRAAADHVKLDAKFTSTLRVDEGFVSWFL